MPLVAAGEGAVWIEVSSFRLRSGLVLRIDPFLDSVENAFSVGAQPSGIAAGLGSVWVTSAVGGTLSRVDPGSGEILAQLDVGKTPTDVTVGEGLVWIAVA
ncbi:MAG TPA: hypothetical protein VFR38_08470 [Gaiellaceae bacterium]|nr:hypothetical protein [Gaiellaceae bacterium]